MTINERIFEILRKQGKKQTDLAAYLNVHNTTVTDWKRGRTAPSITRLEDIAEYLGISIDYLCTGKEYTPTVNQGIFGDKNTHNTVTINGNNTVELSEMESELLKVFGELDIRRKTALLSHAYELEKELQDK